MIGEQGMGHNGYGPEDEDRYDAETYSAAEESEYEELDLADDDEPLPWLESDYDDEDEGVDTGRLIGFVLLSLVALAAILAIAWYFLRDKPDPDLMPEGSTIEAPEGAVKEKPEDEGGKTFEGTGNIAPTVGEGQSTEGRLGTGTAAETAPRPSIDAASSSTAASDPAPAPASGSVGVQVGAYSTRESATTAWATLRGQTSALNGVNNRIVEGEVDGSKVYRLQAVPGDEAAANRLCNTLKNEGIACQVKR